MARALPSPKFRQHPSMLMVGVVQTYTLTDAQKLIPLLWGDFFTLELEAIHTAVAYYGISVRADSESMDYMVAAEVASFHSVDVPHRLMLPPANYAIFTIDKLAGIVQEWQSIYSVWMPGSGHRPADSPAFERYDQRYDPETQTGAIELWVPVEPAR